MILRNLVGKKKAILRIESHQTAYQTSRDWSILIVFIITMQGSIVAAGNPFSRSVVNHGYENLAKESS